MRRFAGLFALAILLVPFAAAAQETKTVRGKVTAISGDSLSIMAGDKDMKFAVDTKTMVVARGGTTKTQKAQEEGKPGPMLADIIKVGDGVEVKYHDMGTMLHAAEIRGGVAVSSTPSSAAAAPRARATGAVTSVSADSLTIKTPAKEMTFVIDAKTNFIARGASTLARKLKREENRALVITDVIKMDDRVQVRYHDMGTMLHAYEVRKISGKL